MAETILLMAPIVGFLSLLVDDIVMLVTRQWEIYCVNVSVDRYLDRNAQGLCSRQYMLSPAKAPILPCDRGNFRA